MRTHRTQQIRTQTGSPGRPPRCAPSKRTEHFTLTELLVVIGIMAMVAAITVVSVGPMMEGGRLDSGARIVKSMIQRARTYAAVQGRQASVWFDPTDKSISVFAGNSNTDLGNRIHEPAFLPAGIDFRLVSNQVVTDDTDPPEQVGDAIVLAPSGGIDGDSTEMAGLDTGENARVWLEGAEQDTYRVIEVMFTTGLPRSFDQ